jgi:FixJ family two-component response regulator
MKAKIDDVILDKLQTLSPSKKAEVLNFVDYLSGKNKNIKKQTDIYAYTSRLIKAKKMKRLSLKEIASIVHKVRGIE